MIRLFEQHCIRHVTELNGIWEFYKDGSSKPYQLPVPGCWEQHPELLSYRGKGTYIKMVHITSAGNIKLNFKGISHTATVFFDGKEVAHHYNAYTPFFVILKKVPTGIHELRIDVDNSFTADSALHIPNDYYTYGGITRGVELEYIPDAYIERIKFTPKKENGKWSAQTEVTVCNLSDNRLNLDFSYNLENEEVYSENFSLGKNEKKVLKHHAVFGDVREWSPDSPKLYLLNANISINGISADDLTERVGFRSFEVFGDKLLLNGNPIFLKGINRHEDCATFGCAVPLQIMAQDIDLIIDMGLNAVRTCHYPNDEIFLDLCDEHGILVWEENHARGLSLEQMQNPNFEKQCFDCIHEMLVNHINHPSIVIWGILNECASETEEGRRMYSTQFEQIHNYDTTRPVTFATCRHFTDICLDLPDIVSYNLYAGWYVDESAAQYSDKEIKWGSSAGGSGKPIIISEFGAAAIYGYRDRSHCKWSEERQADILRENLDAFLNDDRISGVFIWQFADCRVTEEGGWFATRARCHNNKGILDEYRRPKIAYDVIKNFFSTNL